MSIIEGLMLFKAIIFIIVVILALDVRKTSRDVNEKFGELLSVYGVEDVHEDLAAIDPNVAPEHDSEARTTISQHVHERELQMDERNERLKNELAMGVKSPPGNSHQPVSDERLYNIDHAEADKEIIAERNNKEEYSE